MLLAIDIGNTTISLGLMNGKRIIQNNSIEVGISQVLLRSELKKLLTQIKRKHPNLYDVVICSVVPEVLNIVERSVVQFLKTKPRIIGKHIKVPLKNNYRKPSQVGQDRLVCAYAAKQLYGAPAIVIDFGTAITFDVISKRGSYEGGIIVPGIRLSAESLNKKTALLPNIHSIKGPRSLIGKDTQESILSGLFNGYGSMCNGLIDRISKKISGRPKIIITGGHTDLMKKYIAKRITKIDNSLVFKGIYLLANSA